jgi:hypothetical protein
MFNIVSDTLDSSSKRMGSIRSFISSTNIEVTRYTPEIILSLTTEFWQVLFASSRYIPSPRGEYTKLGGRI